MDWETLRGWITPMLAMVGAAGGALSLWLRGQFAGRGEVAALGQRLAGVEAGLAEVRADMEAIPTRSEFHELDRRLVEAGGKLDVLGERIAGLSQLMSRLTAQLDIVFEADRRTKP